MGLEGGSVSFLWQRVGHQAAKFAEYITAGPAVLHLSKTYLQLWSKPNPRSPKACNLILLPFAVQNDDQRGFSEAMGRQPPRIDTYSSLRN